MSQHPLYTNEVVVDRHTSSSIQLVHSPVVIAAAVPVASSLTNGRAGLPPSPLIPAAIVRGAGLPWLLPFCQDRLA